MRMHTIPQNVTAYQDKIVGMLIGRQFIYLAVGGVTVFILLTVDVGPLFIRIFVAMLVGLFSAAMALLKLNDRGFDSLVVSYAKSMFGPTEWVWRKDILPMSKLSAITAQVTSTMPAANQPQDTTGSSIYQQNLQRVSRYQTFVAQRETSTLDETELSFIEQLNFSEPVPQSAFEAASENKPAPPMLTKANFSQVKLATKPDPVVFSVPQPEPITRMAGNSAQERMTIAVDGRSQSISLRHNQRTNRSLSRHLMSAGVKPLPVRGEMQFDITPELKSELTSIKNVAPAETNPAPQTNLAGYPVAEKNAPAEPAPRSAVSVAPPPTPVSQRPSGPHTAIDYAEDWAKKANVRQQIAALSQGTPNFGITKGIDMSASPTNQPTPPAGQPDNQPSSLPTMSGTGDVKVIKDADRAPTNGEITPDLQQQLSQVEGQTRQAISEIEQTNQSSTTQNTPLPNQPGPGQPPTDVAAGIPEHHHEEFQPVREVPPVINEQVPAQPAPAAPPPIHPDPVPQLAGSTANPTSGASSHLDLQDKMAAAGVGAVGQAPPAANPTAPTVQPSQPTQPMTMTTQPNIINGRVLDAQNQSLPGVIVVVKNSQGEPKRALKTNKLGQFIVTTPLANGSYMVEVDKKGLSFDIMKVELTGAVLPPMEIRPK